MGGSDVLVNLHASPQWLVCHHKSFLCLISHLGLAMLPPEGVWQLCWTWRRTLLASWIVSFPDLCKFGGDSG